jgi:DNA (cytosine-5)-methyltransferase 1
MKPKLLGGIGILNFGKQYRQGNRVYDSNSIAMALTAQPLGNLGGSSYLYLVREYGRKTNNNSRSS